MISDAKLTGTRIMVTGGSGFIGRPLCAVLAAAGAAVHATTRRHRPGLDPAVTWHEADLADTAAADTALAAASPEVVYHLAGRVTGVRDVDRVLEVFHDTLTSTVNVLTAAHRRGARRVVLASSMEEPDAGTALAVPSSPYAAAKWASGGYGRMFSHLYGLEVVELRVFMTYGPGYQPLDKLVPAVVLGLLRGQSPTLGSGQRRVDWVYLDDVVAALVRAATADVPVGTRPDIGSGTLLSIRDFVKRLARHVAPDAELVFGARGDRPAEREAVADVASTSAVLGWRPHTDLDTGLARVVIWYRERYEAGDFRRG